MVDKLIGKKLFNIGKQVLVKYLQNISLIKLILTMMVKSPNLNLSVIGKSLKQQEMMKKKFEMNLKIFKMEKFGEVFKI